MKEKNIKKEGFKMRKITLMILAILAAAVLAVSFSGCLSSGSSQNEFKPIEKPAAIQTVTIYTIGDNVMASIVVQIHGTYSQSLDKDNITVNMDKNNINANVPVINKSEKNTFDIGYETVEVVLGKKDQFKDGIYKLTINGNTPRAFTTDFKFSDGKLYSYRSAVLENATVEVVDGKIVVNANVSLAGSAETIDEANITIDRTLPNNDIIISIPTQVQDGATTLILIWKNVAIEVGQLDKMADGTYTATVNGIVVPFTVLDHHLVTATDR